MCLGKLLIEVNADDVPDDLLHRSQFDLDDDDEPPPPIPPKRFEEDPEESQYDDVLRYYNNESCMIIMILLSFLKLNGLVYCVNNIYQYHFPI